MHASSHFPLLVLLPLLLLPLCSSWVTNSLLLLPAPLSTSLRANIKATIVDIDDTSPSDASLISPIALSVLLPTLNSPETLKIVSAETNKKVKSYVPNTLFQPVGYSAATPHGMPQRIHLDYHQHRSHYVIINVPSKLIFDANVFKPSKLCAVYELDHGDLPVPPPSPPPAVEDTPWNNLGETIKDMWVEEEGGEDKVDDDDFDFENFMV